MKPTFFFAVLILCGVSFSSFTNKPSTPAETVSKVVRFNERFFSLIVENDLSVVLTESSSNEIIIEGSEHAIKTLIVNVEDGKLNLSSLPFASHAGVTVYVPAAFLSKVNLYGNSRLSSSSVLNNARLHVLIAGEAKVHLRSNGKVTVEGTPDFDFIKQSK